MIRGWNCENIAHQCLFALINTKDITANPAIFDGYIARQKTGIEVLQQKVGGSMKIPTQALIPDNALRLQHRLEVAGGEVPQIENFQVKGRCHPEQECTAQSHPMETHGICHPPLRLGKDLVNREVLCGIGEERLIGSPG